MAKQDDLNIFTTDSAARSKPCRLPRMTSADTARLIAEAELYAKLDWMKRALQVEFLAELEARPLKERNFTAVTAARDCLAIPKGCTCRSSKGGLRGRSS